MKYIIMVLELLIYKIVKSLPLTKKDEKIIKQIIEKMEGSK